MINEDLILVPDRGFSLNLSSNIIISSSNHNEYCPMALKKYMRYGLVYLFFLLLCFNINAASLSVPAAEGKQYNITDKNLLKVDIFYYRNFPYRKSYANQEIKNCIKMPSAGIVHCKEFISLIRSKNTVNNWLRRSVKGNCFNLPSKEFGVKHTLGCISKITPIDFLSADKKINSTDSFSVAATGLFIRHVLDVRKYTFKNVGTHMVFSVKATPEHPVYSVSRHTFVPVSQLLPEDVLLSENGNKIHLLCRHGINQGIKNGCGIPVNKGGITSVYNLEAGYRHTYFVQNENLLVHNCNGIIGNKRPGEKQKDMVNLIGHRGDQVEFSSSMPLKKTRAGRDEPEGRLHVGLYYKNPVQEELGSFNVKEEFARQAKYIKTHQEWLDRPPAKEPPWLRQTSDSSLFKEIIATVHAIAVAVGILTMIGVSIGGSVTAVVSIVKHCQKTAEEDEKEKADKVAL